ncbi:processive 1,2-diacylglycerol beta-glucosyltransferase [Lysinibacillus parviboronicapiens]|uniref:Processive 1,2-diacylglycerol beta-glucosyltransferase n=1 Tax=Lysinibacillus parviboronicapiens TaxID=436516 RepID=A0ABV2PFB9_9BACI
MKRILFMPFLQMSSGHHQVANGIMDSLHETKDLFECEKTDILSYSYGYIEVIISKFYIKMIHLFPNIYSWLYKKYAYKNENKTRRFHLYEWMFLYWMDKLINEKNPHLIICTHALPSYLLNHLKQKGRISVPVINIYTDYFINQLWGIQCIDYHFVPNGEIKENLIERGVNSNHVFVTGIPIHPQFKVHDEVDNHKSIKSVIISGGNLGTGLMKDFVKKIQPSGEIEYIVLCGENKKLFTWIKRLNNPLIQAVPYISSKEEMNRLYSKVDAIITKPGGVTVSECLFKKIPIFIYYQLPGQEEINLLNLKRWGLVYHLESWRETTNYEEKIVQVLHCEKHQKQLNKQLDNYHQHLSKENISELIERLLLRTP